MPEEKERPRPHGDPLKDEIANSRVNQEDNQAQAQSDASPDVVGEESDRDRGRGSDANGIPASDLRYLSLMPVLLTRVGVYRERPIPFEVVTIGLRGEVT